MIFPHTPRSSTLQIVLLNILFGWRCLLPAFDMMVFQHLWKHISTWPLILGADVPSFFQVTLCIKTRPSVDYPKAWVDQLCLFPWSGKVFLLVLCMWPLGGSHQPLSCMRLFLAWWNPTERTNNQAILEQTSSWPASEKGSLLQLLPL